MARVGSVYILSNSLMPGLLKIGFTNNCVEKRMRELNTTGIPTPFTLELLYETTNAESKERKLHNLLSSYRVNSKREFFKISAEEVGRLIAVNFSQLSLNTNKSSLHIRKILAEEERKRLLKLERERLEIQRNEEKKERLKAIRVSEVVEQKGQLQREIDHNKKIIRLLKSKLDSIELELDGEKWRLRGGAVKEFLINIPNYIWCMIVLLLVTLPFLIGHPMSIALYISGIFVCIFGFTISYNRTFLRLKILREKKSILNSKISFLSSQIEVVKAAKIEKVTELDLIRNS